MLNDEYNEMYNKNSLENVLISETNYPTNRFEFAMYHAKMGGGDVLCDVGMGGGEMIYALRNKFKKFYGIELSEQRIELAKQRCSSMDTTFLNIPFDEDIASYGVENVDTVVCLDVLDHMLNPRKALVNMYNCLKDDGTLIITVPNIARINRRIQLLMGKFPSTSTSDEGLSKLNNSDLIDGGKLHYFTFYMMKSLIYEAGFKKIKEYGVGKRPRIYNFYPKLLSGSISLVCYKQDGFE